MQNIRFAIAAGETKRFEASGRYLEIIDAAGPVDIALSDAAGGIADIARGILSGTYMGTPYAGFNITSATAQTVELFVSATEGGTKRQPGVVSIIDGERAKVLQGVCFSAVAEVTGAAGGPKLQVFNPAASGKLIYVTAVTLGVANADSWGFKTCSNQLPTTPSNVPSNHDRSGAASSALVRVDSTAGALTAERVFRTGYLAATQDRVLVLPRPVLLREGFGAVVYCNTATNTMRAAFEFEEWPA